MPNNNELVPVNVPSTLVLDELPEEWRDPDRVNVLYSPLRNRQVNARDWDSKLQSWEAAIYQYCRYKKLYSFTLNQLEAQFMHDGKAPVCLEHVVRELTKQNKFIPIEEFLKKSAETWGAWATGVLVNWTQRVKSTMISTNIRNTTFIYLTLVQESAEALHKKIPQELLNKVMELEQFTKALGILDDIKLQLHYLESMGKVTLKEVKQAKSNNTVTFLKFYTLAKHKDINDIDIDICQLKHAVKLIEHKIEEIEKNILELVEEAKKHLKNKHRQLAKLVLINKSLLQKKLVQYANQHQNILTLLYNCESLAESSNITDAYTVALDNMKAKLKDLQYDKVEDLLVEVEDNIEQSNEIESTLGRDLGAVEDINDLEAELESLMKDSGNDDNPKSPPTANNESKADDSINLPDIPVSNPGIDELSEQLQAL